jgi:hypothetical protein
MVDAMRMTLTCTIVEEVERDRREVETSREVAIIDHKEHANLSLSTFWHARPEKTYELTTPATLSTY